MNEQAIDSREHYLQSCANRKLTQHEKLDRSFGAQRALVEVAAGKQPDDEITEFPLNTYSSPIRTLTFRGTPLTKCRKREGGYLEERRRLYRAVFAAWV